MPDRPWRPDQTFFLREGAREVGPFTKAEIVALLEQSRLDGRVLARRADRTDWRPVGTIATRPRERADPASLERPAAAGGSFLPPLSPRSGMAQEAALSAAERFPGEMPSDVSSGSRHGGEVSGLAQASRPTDRVPAPATAIGSTERSAAPVPHVGESHDRWTPRDRRPEPSGPGRVSPGMVGLAAGLMGVSLLGCLLGVVVMGVLRPDSSRAMADVSDSSAEPPPTGRPPAETPPQDAPPQDAPPTDLSPAETPSSDQVSDSEAEAGSTPREETPARETASGPPPSSGETGSGGAGTTGPSPDAGISARVETSSNSEASSGSGAKGGDTGTGSGASRAGTNRESEGGPTDGGGSRSSRTPGLPRPSMPGATDPERPLRLRSDELVVDLVWSSRDNLDLAVVSPEGAVVDWRSPGRVGGGHLEQHANNYSRALTESPRERVTWRRAAVRGEYRISVAFRKRHGAQGAVPFEVTVRVGSVVESFQGTLDAEGEDWTRTFSF